MAKVLETFVEHGAPAEIAYLNKPHLGTDRLCAIVKNIREYIVKSGGEIKTGLLHFQFQSKKSLTLIVEKAKISFLELHRLLAHLLSLYSL